MGHAVDQNLLSLVQQDVKELIKKFTKTDAEQTAIQESLAQQRKEQIDTQSSTKVQLEEHDEQLKVVLEWKEQQIKESEEILKKLLSVEKTLHEELLSRVEGVEKGLAVTDGKLEQLKQGLAKTDDKVDQLEQGLSKTEDKVEQLERGFAKTDDKVEQLEQGFAKTDDKVEQLEQEFAKTDDKVEQLEQGFAKTDDKVEQLEQGIAKTDDKVEKLEQELAKTDDKVEQLEKDVSETGNKVKQLVNEVRSQRIKENNSAASPVNTFDVKACQKKLAEHYQRTAKVPTTVWSSAFQVDLDQIYTRLSWVKDEQTPAGLSQRELRHYTQIFTEKTKNEAVPKRILVQGETGIGKTTFVKRLLVDWYNLEEAKMDEERKEALRKFELVVSINLKDVSKCQTLREVISCSRLFPEDEEQSVDDLLSYIRKNQDKVLFVFDGYDEYRTGSEAEEKYGSRSSSPINEIFRGNILRDCTVLVTTRSSRADELRGPADIQAEITGFNMSDREEFMGKVLESQTQVDDLLRFLWKSKMEDLARVPLLTLFFCLLWKEEKETLMELIESKTKLYQEIVEHIVQHSRRKHFSSQVLKLKEEDYKEILAEIGKVALAGLLKGDLVFKYGQLPENVRGKESLIIGLLQLSEYGPSLKPMEMVSFIHKSIQEYLAAWYITYRCVPEGSLGGIEQHARTLEDCQALENVFQFVCGLSDDGAVKVLEHLKSVRISDPTLDLSKLIPDVENETDVPLCDVTVRQKSFSDLVYDSFREVQSKAELLKHCFACTGGAILVNRDRPLPEFMPKVDDLARLAHFGTFIFSFSSWDGFFEDSVLYKLLEFLKCLQIQLRITESCKVPTFGDFVRKFQNVNLGTADSSFISILSFRYGQFQFHVTDLLLVRDGDVGLFTEITADSVPSLSANLCSDMSYLKFLTSLRCFDHLSGQKGKALGAAIGNCKHLKRIVVTQNDDSVCDLLEHVQNPSKCSLEIGRWDDFCCHLTSAGAVKLGTLLPRFNNITLYLGLSNCCSVAVETLVTSITHKTLKRLKLSGIRLTPAGAAALGRSLPEMSTLEVLTLTGMDESIVQAYEIEALFGGFSKALPLKELTFSVFTVKGSLTPLTKSLQFFPDLKKVKLENLNMDEHDQCGLLESLKFIPNLRALSVQGEPLGQAHRCTVEVNTVRSFAQGTKPTYKKLELHGISLTPKVVTALGQLLPEIPLLELKLTGVDGSILQAEEMEALVGGFNNTFPNLRALKLEKLKMDEHDQCGLLESFSFIPNLTALSVQCKPLGDADCCTVELSTDDLLERRTSKSLKLYGIRLTPAATAALGRLLPEISSLNTVEVIGEGNVNILQDKEIEALFGGFNKILPLYNLIFHGFSVEGSIAAVTKSFRFFPYLIQLYLREVNMDEHNLWSLLESLRFIPNLRELMVHGKYLAHADCCTVEVNPIGRFILKDLMELALHGISLTPATAVALGQSLPEMSSLKGLVLTGSILQDEEMKVLFGGFNKTLPLQRLTVDLFGVRGCLASLTKSFRFFPKLRGLSLGDFNMDEHNLCLLLEGLRFIPNLEGLSVHGNPLVHTYCCCTAKVNTVGGFIHKDLVHLRLDGIRLTPATAAALGQSLPEMSSLKRLVLSAVDGSILQLDHMEALFGGINKTLPLEYLIFHGFSVRGCLAPLRKSFCFFPSLKDLLLTDLNMDGHDLSGLLESFRFIPNLKMLSLSGNPLGHAVTSIVPHIRNLPVISEFYLYKTCSGEDLSYVERALPHIRFRFSFFYW
ncbi:uncharacterized protein LOC144651012 isoform X2 [Oculina patagonica]